MGQFVNETAHKQYIGNKTYQDNWERIFGNKKENNEESNEEETCNKEQEGVQKESTN